MLTVLGLLLVVLKVTGLISISWFWALSPFLIPVGFWTFTVVMLITAAIIEAVS